MSDTPTPPKRIATDDQVDAEDSVQSGATAKNEHQIFDAYSQSRANLIREENTRHTLRRLAIAATTAFLVILLPVWGVGSWYLLYHRHDLPSVYVIAVMITPVVSITAILTTMLLAAFRGRKDEADRATDAAADLAQPARNGGA